MRFDEIQAFDDGGQVGDNTPMQFDDIQPEEASNANQNQFANIQPAGPAQPSQPGPTPGPIGAAIAGAAPAAAPITAAIAAGTRGAALGTALAPELAPWSSIAGGLAAGLIASGVVGKIQDWLRDKYGPSTGPLSKPYEAAAEKQQPLAYNIGRVAPIAAGMSTGAGLVDAAGKPLITPLIRAASAGLMGSVDVMQQGIEKGFGNINPTEALTQAAAGAVLPQAREWAGGARPQLATKAPAVGEEATTKLPTPAGEPGTQGPATSAQQKETPVGKPASDAQLAEQQAQSKKVAPVNTSNAPGTSFSQPAVPGANIPHAGAAGEDSRYGATIRGSGSDRQGLKPGVGAGQRGQNIPGADNLPVDIAPIPADVAAARAPETTPTPAAAAEPPAVAPAAAPASVQAAPAPVPAEPPPVAAPVRPSAPPAEPIFVEDTSTGLEGQVPNAQQLIGDAMNAATKRQVVEQPMPSIANSSKDINGPVVIDPQVVKDHPDYIEPLKVHETVEGVLMAHGMDPDMAHDIATRAERTKAESMGINWDEYSKYFKDISPQIEAQKIMPDIWNNLDLHENPYAAIGHHTNKDIQGEFQQAINELPLSTPGTENAPPSGNTRFYRGEDVNTPRDQQDRYFTTDLDAAKFFRNQAGKNSHISYVDLTPAEMTTLEHPEVPGSRILPSQFAARRLPLDETEPDLTTPIPEFLRRQPPAAQEAIAKSTGQPLSTIAPEVPVPRSNLTEADRTAIAEMQTTAALNKKNQTAARLAKLKASQQEGGKYFPGAAWDVNTSKWVPASQRPTMQAMARGPRRGSTPLSDRYAGPMATLRQAWDKMFNGSTALPEDLQQRPGDPLSDDADASAKAIGDSIGDRFNQFKTSNLAMALRRVNLWRTGLGLTDNAGWEKVADAYENKTVDQLPPELKPAADHYAKIQDYNNTRKEQIQQFIKDNPWAKQMVKLPDMNEDPEKGFVSRLRKTDTIEKPVSDDPIVRDLGTLSPAIMRRDYMALSDSKGERFVVKDLGPSEEEDGHGNVQVWGASKPQFDYEPVGEKDNLATIGSKIKINGKTYTVSHATVDEIHAAKIPENGTDGPPIQYIKNALVRGTAELQGLDKTYNTLKLMEKIRPDIYANGTTNFDEAKANGWKQTILDAYAEKGNKPLYLPDGIRWALDDYAKQGFDTPAQLDRLAGNTLKTLYTFGGFVHVLNEASLWAVGRGWDWITPAGMKSLAQDFPRAMHAVMKAGDGDPIYQEILEHGGNLMYGSVLTREMYRDFMQKAGLEMVQNSKLWDPIAQKLGMDVPQMAQKTYDMSTKMMWAPSDMMYIQRYLELKAKGMTPEQAIAGVESWISNYRLGTTMAGNRPLAQLLGTQGLSAFGRYHGGLWKSLGDWGTKLTTGTPEEKKEAFGQLMVMSVIGLGLYPLLNKGVQAVTGNPEASVGPRGPFTIPAAAYNIATGKAGYESLVPQVFTPSLPVSAAIGAMRNQDWTGRPIIPRGTGPIKGGIEAADYAARTLIPPYGTISNAAIQPSANPATVAGRFGASMTGIKVPSEASARYMQRIPQENAKLAKARAKHPAGIAEKLYGKLTSEQ